MRRHRATGLVILALLAPASATRAQAPAASVREAVAWRIPPATPRPRIDGRLNDLVWQRTDSLDGFVQNRPATGRPSAFRTIARVAFDSRAIYVAVRAFDPNPSAIAARLTRRDNHSASDRVSVAFDSAHDLRTAYEFSVNAAGVQRDLILTNEDDEDERWDAVWESATQTDASGWTAEFRIPFSMLRFPAHGPGVWGLQVARFVEREQELSYWSPFARGEPNPVFHFGALRGLTALAPGRRLELLPSAFARWIRAPGDVEDPFFDANAVRLTGGLDAKVGLTSDLTLDATINPDFGQVEADPAEVNLTVFETFFPERRPFFLEGADAYDFVLDDEERVFYSRRIGREPQERADRRGGFVEAPTETTILGAAKLTGRASGGWQVGLLDAVTAEERATVIDADGQGYRDVVEPRTNYAVIRAVLDDEGAATRIGVTGTSVHRALDGTGLEDRLRTAAYAGGFDAVHRSGGWRLGGHLLGSHIRGAPEAILRAQLSSTRFLQRPDARHVEVDSSATVLSGWGARYDLVRETAERWQAGFTGQIRSPGFELNDVGFLRRADRIAHALFMSYRDLEPGTRAASFTADLTAYTNQTFGGEATGTGLSADGEAQFLDYSGLYGGLAREFSAWDPRALRGGPAIRSPGAFSAYAGLYSDARGWLNGGVNASGRIEDGTGSRTFNVGLDVEWRLGPTSRLAIGPFFEDVSNEWQFVDAPGDETGTTRYVFADLRQRSAGLTVRAEHAFSPTLGIQLYGQPFLSAGSHTRFKEVVDPRAGSFAARFRAFPSEDVERGEGEIRVDADRDGSADFAFEEPDFNFQSWRSNLVARWQYRPGSTLFVIWSHRRSGASADPRFRLGHDVGELFQLPAENILLVKLSGWFTL